MKSILLAISCLFYSVQVFALPEATLNQRYASEVVPFMQKGQWGWFAGAKGANLRYAQFINPDASDTIVIVDGQSEFIEKYSELIYDFYGHGHSVAIYDHRGQGLSSRLAPTLDMCHVDEFDDYVDDLSTFVETVVQRPASLLVSRPLIMFAHSMGGGIGAKYLQRNPTIFDAVIFSSPMMGINTAPFSENVAFAIATVGVKSGFGKHFALTQKGYVRSDSIEKSTVTHSQTRIDIKNYWNDQNPQLRLGGPSYKWVYETMKSTKKMRSEPIAFQGPILLLKAGQETYVQPEYETAYCKNATNCTELNYPNARHEIFNEVDAIRDDALNTLFKFLDK